MRRAVCFMVALTSAAFVGCTSREPAGPIQAAAAGEGETVVVSPSAASLAPGDTVRFSAQLFDNGNATNADFVWTSSNERVATVSSTGLATALAAGEAIITATAEDASDTARVSVGRPTPPQPPEGVTRLPLGGGPFGSVVTAGGTGWIGQPRTGQVTRLDVATATFTGVFSPGPFPVQLAANAAGSRLYVANFFGGQVSSIRTDSMTIVNRVFIGGQDAYGITATLAGDTVFVGITNGPIYKIDMRAESILAVLDLPVAAGYHFEWNNSRTRLYAAQRAFDGGRVFEIEPRSFTLLRTFETGGLAQGIQLSADDSKLFVAAQQGGIIVWDVATNSLDTTYATPGCSGYGLLRTPDNGFLVVGCVFEGLIEVLDPNTGALITTLNVGGRPRELSYDRVTGSILAPNESGWVDIVR